MRGGDNVVTRRRRADRATVWTLSKFTTQSVGTPSRSTRSSSSETSPRLVRVSAATTTEPIRSATRSASTRARADRHRMLLRTIHPAASDHSVLLGGTPVGDLGERGTRPRRVVWRSTCRHPARWPTGAGAGEESVSEQFRPIDLQLGDTPLPRRRSHRRHGNSASSYILTLLYDTSRVSPDAATVLLEWVAAGAVVAADRAVGLVQAGLPALRPGTDHLDRQHHLPRPLVGRRDDSS